jgi:cobalamin synthase
LPCPGCGGLRAVNDLTNGDVAGAMASNAMAVVLVVAGCLWWLAWFAKRLRGHDGDVLSARWATALSGGFGAAFVLFGIYRMTPWGAWLRP